MFCKYKKLFQQVLKKWQSHKITTPPFKSYLISFILLCKSQSHLSTTKTCFSFYTLSLVLASPCSWWPWHSNQPGLTTARQMLCTEHWGAKSQDTQFSLFMVVSEWRFEISLEISASKHRSILSSQLQSS